MIVEARTSIRGSKAAVWAAIADIENAAKLIRGIESIEIVDRPENGLVGLRWRETRILFGKPATVEKRITEAAENTSYRTRAESDGFVFLTTMWIAGSDGSVELISHHDSQPQGLGARLMSIPMSLLFRGVMRKAILQDLDDIRLAVER